MLIKWRRLAVQQGKETAKPAAIHSLTDLKGNIAYYTLGIGSSESELIFLFQKLVITS
jgi:hypothetical protein